MRGREGERSKRETDRLTDRQTNRQTDRQTDRQNDWKNYESQNVWVDELFYIILVIILKLFQSKNKVQTLSECFEVFSQYQLRIISIKQQKLLAVINWKKKWILSQTVFCTIRAISCKCLCDLHKSVTYHFLKLALPM